MSGALNVYTTVAIFPTLGKRIVAWFSFYANCKKNMIKKGQQIKLKAQIVIISRIVWVR